MCADSSAPEEQRVITCLNGLNMHDSRRSAVHQSGVSCARYTHSIRDQQGNKEGDGGNVTSRRDDERKKSCSERNSCNDFSRLKEGHLKLFNPQH